MRSTRGFSLIELSVALVVIGVLMVPVFQQRRQEIMADRLGLTLGNLNQIVPKSIDDFYFRNLRYPCPADPTLNEDDAAFGTEDCTLVSTNTNQARTGMVPFKALGIKYQEALDGYNNRMTYVVTAAHTVTNGPTGSLPLLSILGYQVDPMDGADVRLDGNGDPIIANYTPSGAGYVVVSHGPTGIGAFSSNGVALEACAVVVGTETLESENCDGDLTFFNSISANSDIPGPDFYDDRIYYQGSQPPSRIFVENTASTALLSTYGYYGINNTSPQTEVDVTGTTLAEGNSHAIKFCTGDGSQCFQAAMIGGTGIGCPYSAVASETNGFMTGIGSAAAKCSSFHKAITPKNCATNEYIAGIDASGSPICKPF